jgi:hypothetical protein
MFWQRNRLPAAVPGFRIRAGNSTTVTERGGGLQQSNSRQYNCIVKLAERIHREQTTRLQKWFPKPDDQQSEALTRSSYPSHFQKPGPRLGNACDHPNKHHNKKLFLHFSTNMPIVPQNKH